MANQNFFNSIYAVRASILIGKTLPPKIGYAFCRSFSTFLTRFENLAISRSIRANQFIVNGEKNTRAELIQQTQRILEHAGKCYYDLYHFFTKPEKLESMVPFSESMRKFIQICQQKSGLMVVSPHISNFDLVICGLAQNGFRGKILSFPNPGSGYQLQNEIRVNFGLDITPLGDSKLEAEIVNYLKNGGVTATGVDRPVPGRKKKHYVKFFGQPSPLPVGYITTALAADVPVMVVSAFMHPNGQYGFMYSDPIPLKRYKNKLDDIILNTEMILEKIEGYIRKVPEQWLMYYPVWPDTLKEGI
ncbi:MAG: lysophospholipid acyltransferase family protein [Anaerolineales bacterium]